jgi:hypothetical protein
MPTRQEKINRIKRILKEAMLDYAVDDIDFYNKLVVVNNSIDKEKDFYITLYYYLLVILNKFRWKIDLKEVS